MRDNQVTDGLFQMKSKALFNCSNAPPSTAQPFLLKGLKLKKVEEEIESVPYG
jgi:hypothetical protein